MIKFKKFLVIPIIVLMSFSLVACGSNNKKEEVKEEGVEYDENGNPIEKDDENKDEEFGVLNGDAELMITGLIATMEDGSITPNGFWLTESEVGQIAERYQGDYKYEKGKFKKSEVKYVAVFYDINGERLSSMYFNDIMDMCYNNEYKITDPVMRGIFTELKNRITEDSVITMDKNNSNGTVNNPSESESTQEPPQGENTTISVSMKAFEDAGFDIETSKVLAQSTFNVGIPVIVKAKTEANTIMFTDTNGVEYTMSINDGAITSIWDNTNSQYIWEAN